MPLKQAHWSNRLIEEVDLDNAIVAGSLGCMPLKQAHCRPGSSKRSTLTTPLKQAHLSNRGSDTPLKQAH